MGWGGGWGHVNVPCTSYVICYYAAEISGVLATVYTRRGGVGWCGAMLTFLVLRTLNVARLQRSLALLLQCITKGWGGV